MGVGEFKGFAVGLGELKGFVWESGFVGESL